MSEFEGHAGAVLTSKTYTAKPGQAESSACHFVRFASNALSAVMTVLQQELESVSVRTVAASKATTLAAKTTVVLMAAARREMLAVVRRAGKGTAGHCADGRSFSPERGTVGQSAYET